MTKRQSTLSASQPAGYRLAASGASVSDATSSADPVCADEMHYKLMRLIQVRPGISQRDAARELRVSLGKVNYCLRALAGKGWIKATNFKNSQNKAAYMYLLTRRGLQQKALLGLHYLHVKVREYERLRAEIRQMRIETKVDGPAKN